MAMADSNGVNCCKTWMDTMKANDVATTASNTIQSQSDPDSRINDKSKSP